MTSQINKIVNYYYIFSIKIANYKFVLNKLFLNAYTNKVLKR